MNNSVRNWLVGMATASGLAAISLITFVRATPAPEVASMSCKDACPQIGVEICCPGTSKSELEAQGYTITIETHTNGCFVVTSCVPPCGTNYEVKLDAKEFEGEGQDKELGTIKWRLDKSRSSSPATITSYEPDTEFPAYGTINFYAEAEVEKFPGVIFRSEAEVRLVNKEVRSFNPFKGELYTMVNGPIKFVDEKSTLTFELKELTSLLTEK